MPPPEKTDGSGIKDAEVLTNSSVWVSKEQMEGVEHVGDVVEHSNRRLRIMKTPDGRFFYELKKEPQRQAAVATLLKGIIPVCDIIPISVGEETRYCSYMTPLENEQFAGEQTDEIEADTEVIKLLFNGEHWAGHNLKNIRLDENRRAIFFDFDNSEFDLKINTQQLRHQISFIRENHPNAIPLIREKFTQLGQNLAGETGESWFMRVLDHTNYDPTVDELSRTYEEQVLRGEKWLDKTGADTYTITKTELLIRLRKKLNALLELLAEDVT